MDLSQASPAKGLSVLWARSKIADLEERRFDRQGAAKIDAEILKTALDHHLVSRLTSLVAVDITPSRDLSNPLKSLKVPTQLPEGWDFGKLAAAAPPPPTQSNAAHKSQSPSPQRIAPMPRTASPHVLMTLFGLLLMLFGVITRRRRHV